MSHWKSVERAIAKIIGGIRVPVSGRQRGSAPDIEHRWLSVEVKHRKTLPAWLHDAMNQAEASVEGEQLPIVFLHAKGTPYQKTYAVVRLDDFMSWFGGGCELPEGRNVGKDS